MVRILGIGDAKIDQNLTEGIMYPGGQALNVAVNTKLMGAQSGFIGVIGNNYQGEHLAATLAEIGVDTSHCRRFAADNANTSYRVVDGEKTPGRLPGDRRRGISPLQMAIRMLLSYQGLSEDDQAYMRGFDLCHFTDGSHLEDSLGQLQASVGVPFSFDYSFAYAREGYLELVAPHVAVSLMSCSHISQDEMRDWLRKACALGTRFAIATRGTEGATLYDGRQFFTQPPRLVQAVDTMGAGDAFLSGFLFDFAGSGGFAAADPTENIRHALAYAADWSAKACLLPGAFGHGAPIRPECPTF